jgi:hypothetical protein
LIQVNALEQIFKDKFHFSTEQYEIPPEDSERSLFLRLQAFNRCYDSPSKLGIIYYGGHADRKESKDGVDLELFARRSLHGVSTTETSLDNISLPGSPIYSKGDIDISFPKTHTEQPRPQQPHISFKAICQQIKASETDMLLVVDSCFAAGAFTDQPFGGRKCELFCSIAEKDWARAPGHEGSFTKILTTTLAKMIEETPLGFSTSDLYRRVYQQQHQTHKPFLFNQSKFDFGRIWLRPCRQKGRAAMASAESKFTIDLRIHLAKSLDLMELNKVVKALQWIPYVQMVKMQSMHSPNDELSEFIRTVYLANRLRPVLARVRRKLELKKARQLYRTNSSPSPRSAPTSERFHIEEPREVALFDWSKTEAVTPYDGRLTSDQYFHSKRTTHPKLSDLQVPTKGPAHPAIADAALQIWGQDEREGVSARPSDPFTQRVADVCLSQRTLDRLSFFVMGVLAPTLIRWAIQGSASPFAAA